MNKLLISLLLAVTVLFCQCGQQGEPLTPSYNELVTAYTSGTLPRKASLRIVLSQDIDTAKLQTVKAEKVLTLSPKVEGEYTFSDPHTLEFTPSAEMKRNTLYTVKLDLNQLFGEGGVFSYTFQTRPFALGGSLKSFDVTDDNEYKLTYSLQTADSEDKQLVEKMVTLSQECQLDWSHTEDGTQHQLVATVKPEKAIKLELSTQSDRSLGAEGRTLSEIDLPSTKELAIVNKRSGMGESRYVELTFNKKLDPRQSAEGLTYIALKATKAIKENNKLRLYAPMEEGETLYIKLFKALRAADGTTLGKDDTISVHVNTIKPLVEFVGDGSIIPQGDKILVPFRSVHMRGVRVLVYKIYANMMGSKMQRGDIANTSNLYYAARPVAATTFYMDEQGADLSEWHTYAIDLTEQFKVEPGAMYRIELSLDPRLSAWEGDSLPRASRQEMEAEDAELLNRANLLADNDSWYYTGQAFPRESWWVDNYYQLRQDPSTPYYYEDKTVGKNILATNIGLSAMRGVDNTLSVTAINLPDAKTLSGVKVEVFNMQQQSLGLATTGSNGIAKIVLREGQGRPLYLVARLGDDVSYLYVAPYEALSTSTFDVSGDVIERGLKGYIYGERGVWRPGDTLHIGFMLNDKVKSLPADHPVTLQLSNPLGQVVNRITKTKGQMGLYTFVIPTAEDAPTGVWSAQISVGGVSFCKNLRIEAIKPNRLKIDLGLPESTLSQGKNAAELHTEWLNGNPASDLKYDISATIVETPTQWKHLKDFVFDDPTKSFETTEQEISKGAVDGQGSATPNLTFKVDKKSPGMLKCNLVTHVYEPSGEFSTDVTQALLAPYSCFVGIKAPAQTKQTHLNTDTPYAYQVMTVDKNGQPMSNRSVKVDVYKVSWYWWWSSIRENAAGYTSSSYNSPVETYNIKTDGEGKGSFSLNMARGDWGTYLIMVKDVAEGHSAGTMSYFDWPDMTSRRNDDSKDNATLLSITTDKKEYTSGEKMTISFPSEEGSTAIVSICNGSKILRHETYPCQKERTSVTLDVTEDMQPNIYIYVSLVQRYEQTVNDMPIRMYGVVPVSVTSPKSHLTPLITCAEEFQPEMTQVVKVQEKEGRPMAYTLAIVDEGLLDLTHFKTPNAWNLFNAREALGVNFWDLYKHVNGAFGGRIEQLFSIGGDEALNNAPKAIVNRFTPMVYFAGPFTLKKSEIRTHSIDVPNYNGRVRVMVVAGDGQAYGNAEKSVLVRRPLMLIGTMPRQIGAGDEMTVSATVFASQAMKDVKVTLAASGNLNVVGNAESQLSFSEAGDQTVQFRIKASQTGKVGTVRLHASSGEYQADYTTEIKIRIVSQEIKQSLLTQVGQGGTFTENLTVPGDADFKLSYELSTNPPLNVNNRLNDLICYPHGCAEQITSKAFPQLCLSEFAYLTTEQLQKMEKDVKMAIDRLKSYQTSDGGMAYWPNGRVANAWASAYVLHFFTEAAARGYYVPEDMVGRLRKYVSNVVKSWTPGSDTGAAYGLFVLANAQMPELGAMNRMKEHVTELSLSEQYLLAAAYALSGRSDVSYSLIEQPHAEGHFYWLSDDVARLYAQTYLAKTPVNDTYQTLRKELMSDNWLSTSMVAQSLIAISKFYQQNKVGSGLQFSTTVGDQKEIKVQSDKFSWTNEAELSKSKVKLQVTNHSKAPLYLNYTVSGVATQSPVPATENGLALSIRYVNNDGQTIDPKSLTQSTTFRAILTVRNTSGKKQENIAVTHILPAGWEVLSAAPSSAISYQDRRDDRIHSYIDRLNENASVTIDVTLSATYAGKYYLPAIQAEAMYDATISGCTASGECVVE